MSLCRYIDVGENFDREHRIFIKGILSDWLMNGPDGIEVVAKRFSSDTGYYYLDLKVRVYQDIYSSGEGPEKRAMDVLSTLEKMNLKGQVTSDG